MNTKTRVVGDARELRDLFPALPQTRQSWSLWSSPETLAAHVHKSDKSTHWAPAAWREDDESFFGSRSMPNALAMALTGWPEGAERVARLRDRINAANPTGPRLVRWDVAGAFPNVPRALSGNPLNMRRIDSARLRRRPVLTLLSDMSANWTVAGAAITNRAAVVAAVADAIEAAGYSCHVVAFCRVVDANNGLTHVAAATVKESDKPADIGRLAFGLGHVAMFRRLCWTTITEDRFTEGLSSNLGLPAPLPAELPANTFVIPSADGRNERLFVTEDAAATSGLAFLLSALAKQGCPAFPNTAAVGETTPAPAPETPVPAPAPRRRRRRRWR